MLGSRNAKQVFKTIAEHDIFDDESLSNFDAIVMLAGHVTVSPTILHAMLYEKLPYSGVDPHDP